MPLVYADLGNALANIGPKEKVHDAAEAWFKAWFDFACNMTYFLPTIKSPSAELSVKDAFVSALEGAMSPSSTPDAFFNAWAAAQVTAYSTLSTYLMTAYASITPATPTVLPTMLQGIPALGTAKTQGACQEFAQQTYLWTITPLTCFYVVPATPPYLPLPFA